MSNPIWRINPLKIEILSWDPYLIQFHDVIGEGMIHFLREEAVPSLARAEPSVSLYNPKADFVRPRQLPQNYRPTFSTTRLHTKDFGKILEDLDRKIGLITKLRVVNGPNEVASEAIEISSHAPGGHYYLHNDAVRPPKTYPY
jgi:hypothetical protein